MLTPEIDAVIRAAVAAERERFAGRLEVLAGNLEALAFEARTLAAAERRQPEPDPRTEAEFAERVRRQWVQRGWLEATVCQP